MNVGKKRVQQIEAKNCQEKELGLHADKPDTVQQFIHNNNNKNTKQLENMSQNKNVSLNTGKVIQINYRQWSSQT